MCIITTLCMSVKGSGRTNVLITTKNVPLTYRNKRCQGSFCAMADLIRARERRIFAAPATAGRPRGWPGVDWSDAAPEPSHRQRCLCATTYELRKGQRKGCGGAAVRAAKQVALAFLEAADRTILGVAVRQQGREVEPRDLDQLRTQHVAGDGDHGGGVGVRAALRLGDDRVDDPELAQILVGDLHGAGGVGSLGRVAP